jgi:hypothetical protein
MGPSNERPPFPSSCGCAVKHTIDHHDLAAEPRSGAREIRRGHISAAT